MQRKATMSAKPHAKDVFILLLLKTAAEGSGRWDASTSGTTGASLHGKVVPHEELIKQILIGCIFRKGMTFLRSVKREILTKLLISRYGMSLEVGHDNQNRRNVKAITF